jgi:hypothetical protein
MSADTSSTASTSLSAIQPVDRARPRLVWLWIAWVVLLAAAIVLGNWDRHGSTAATAARMGSSVVLVVAAWTFWSWWRETAVGTFAICVALGMTLGAIGDFFNAGLLGFIPLPDPVLGGIAAFALGHVAYITGCLHISRVSGLTNRAAFIGSILFWQLFGVIGWYVVVWQGTEARMLVWPALPYSLLLAGTAGVTGGLALQDRRFVGLALGGALFLASDLILACGLFRGSLPYQTEMVWLTYGPAQMLIVFSVATAAALLERSPAPVAR